jgi:nitrate reductase beta subunit
MGQHEQLFCSLDTDGGPGMGGMGPTGPHGIGSYQPTGTPGAGTTFKAEDGRTHFNLLGWDAKGSAPQHLFPQPGTP